MITIAYKKPVIGEKRLKTNCFCMRPFTNSKLLCVSHNYHYTHNVIFRHHYAVPQRYVPLQCYYVLKIQFGCTINNI